MSNFPQGNAGVQLPDLVAFEYYGIGVTDKVKRWMYVVAKDKESANEINRMFTDASANKDEMVAFIHTTNTEVRIEIAHGKGGLFIIHTRHNLDHLRDLSQDALVIRNMKVGIAYREDNKTYYDLDQIMLNVTLNDKVHWWV